MTIFW